MEIKRSSHDFVPSERASDQAVHITSSKRRQSSFAPPPRCAAGRPPNLLRHRRRLLSVFTAFHSASLTSWFARSLLLSAALPATNPAPLPPLPPSLPPSVASEAAILPWRHLDRCSAPAAWALIGEVFSGAHATLGRGNQPPAPANEICKELRTDRGDFNLFIPRLLLDEIEQTHNPQADTEPQRSAASAAACEGGGEGDAHSEPAVAAVPGKGLAPGENTYSPTRWRSGRCGARAGQRAVASL